MSHLNEKNVLLIEDEAETRLVARRIFEGNGAHFFEAENGEKGIQLALETLPHAIVLDLGMPGINGFEFLKRKQDTPELRCIPVIVLSSTSDLLTVKSAVSLGAFDYCLKPVRALSLVNKVTRALFMQAPITYAFNERPRVAFSLPGLISVIDETTLKMESTIRIAPDTDVELQSGFLKKLLGEGVRFRTRATPPRLGESGRYIHEVNLIGMNPDIVRKIRNFLGT